ncbi:MAG TPA: hypothetical protein VGI10_29910 [Polyangiaceae bacterium]
MEDAIADGVGDGSVPNQAFAPKVPNQVLNNPEFKVEDTSETWENLFAFIMMVSPLGPEEAAAGGLERAGATLSKAEVRGLRELFGKGKAGAEALASRIRAGESVQLPQGVTRTTLGIYRGLAERAISLGKDARLGVQAARKEAIDLLLGAP